MKRYLTFEYDSSDVFDSIVKVGDQGETLGKRLVGIMLEGPRFVTDLGLGVYGITPRHTDTDPRRVPPEIAAALKSIDYPGGPNFESAIAALRAWAQTRSA